jgi:hypothetical protein
MKQILFLHFSSPFKPSLQFSNVLAVIKKEDKIDILQKEPKRPIN